MTWFDFIARLADALAWPVVVLVVAVVLRRPIVRALTQGPLKRIKAAGFEVEWDRVAAETEVEVKDADRPSDEIAPSAPSLESDLAPEATGAPAVAVLKAHATVVRELQSMVGSVEQTGRVKLAGAVWLARKARERELISDASVRAIEGISVLRNLVAHGESDSVTSERAREYLTLVDGVLYAIRSEYEKATSQGRPPRS